MLFLGLFFTYCPQKGLSSVQRYELYGFVSKHFTIKINFSLFMRKLIVFLLLIGFVLADTGCNRTGCPANSETHTQKRKKGAASSGLFPKDFARKKGLQ